MSQCRDRLPRTSSLCGPTSRGGSSAIRRSMPRMPHFRSLARRGYRSKALHRRMGEKHRRSCLSADRRRMALRWVHYQHWPDSTTEQGRPRSASSLERSTPARRVLVARSNATKDRHARTARSVKCVSLLRLPDAHRKYTSAIPRIQRRLLRRSTSHIYPASTFLRSICQRVHSSRLRLRPRCRICRLDPFSRRPVLRQRQIQAYRRSISASLSSKLCCRASTSSRPTLLSGRRRHDVLRRSRLERRRLARRSCCQKRKTRCWTSRIRRWARALVQEDVREAFLDSAHARRWHAWHGLFDG